MYRVVCEDIPLAEPLEKMKMNKSCILYTAHRVKNKLQIFTFYNVFFEKIQINNCNEFIILNILT